MGAETVTVLFTDLVGSTALLSRVGQDRAEELRREHFSLLRDAVTEVGGREVKNLGDGLMVVFGVPSAALDAAVGIQQRLETRNRRTDEQLLIRVGVSMGEADVEDGDYFGPPVVEAGRLCAAAKGGQVLTTEIVRALTSARGRHRFEPVGEVEFKGFDAPVSVWSVGWDPLADATGVPLPDQLSRELPAGFVGRDVERALLVDALKETVSERRRRVVLIGGEPGIGKTTLAVEAAQRAFEVGATVLYGRCDEDLGIPYQPWIEALSHLVEHAPEPLIDTHFDECGGELVRLVPRIAQRRPDLPPSRVSDPETGRYLLFGAVKGLLRVAGDNAPVVVVLDDLHWADKPTLLLLRHLIAASDRLRLVVVGTFRESELTAGHPLTDLLVALHREEGIVRLSLRGLDDIELLELMTATAGHEMGPDGVELSHALRRETDGNPFFVAEILRHLAETGAIYQQEGIWVASADLRDSGLPVSVREVIGRRIARLGDLAVRVLGVGAVIGREFDASLVARVAGVDDDALIDLLDQAVDVTLVEEVPSEPGRYSFVHALIEHTLYDGLSASRRALTHRRVAEALEAVYGADRGDHLGELAYHWVQATAPQEPLKAIDYTCRAAERALVQLAPDEALRWYTQAIELFERAPVHDEGLRCELLVGLGSAQRQAGIPGSRETLLDAARLAQQLGAGALLVRAALANSRGFASDVRRADTERIAVLEMALDAAATAADRARLLALLGSELVFGGDYFKRRALSDDAVALARQAGDPATLAFVLNRRLSVISVPETIHERARILEEIQALVGDLSDPVLESFTLSYRHLHAREVGDTDAALDALGRSAEVTERLELPGGRWSSTWAQSLAALLRGDLDTAEQLADKSLAVGTEIGEPDALPYFAALLLAVRWHQGRKGELEPLVAQVAAETPGVPGFVAELAHCRIEAGNHDGARALLDAAAADDFASIPHDMVWTTTLALWSEITVHLDSLDTASVLLNLLAPYPDLAVFNGVSTFGPIAEYLGMLGTTLGDYEQADHYFDDAMTVHSRLQAPFFVARTYLHRAGMQLRRDAPGDRDLVMQNLNYAIDIARRHDFAGIERDATTLQRKYGL